MEQKRKKTAKKNDIVLIALILAVAVLFQFGIRIYQGTQTKEAVAVVKIGDTEYGRFLLSETHTERIELPDGSYNLLEIRDGSADVTEASCPDGICVNHRAISRRGESIVCLPNAVVVEIENGEEAVLDAVAN